MDTVDVAPDTVLASNDPGDETARRFRYQWSFAAIICCMLLDEAQSVEEVFCEHHEDVLIKRKDGSFLGLQVKTRASNQPVWKTDDDEVKGACARFAKLEADFPEQFSEFRFLTNHILYSSENGKNLNFIFNKFREAETIDALPNSCKLFLSHITKKAGCTDDVAFTALSKTYARDDLPKLSDIEVRLVTELTQVWRRAQDCSYSSVQRAARYLVSECERASSLAHKDILPAYLSATKDPERAELDARIAAKRINKQCILQFLEFGLESTAQLEGNPNVLVEPGAGREDLLLKKLDAGGFSAVSRNSALDLRDKADYLGIVWTKKHGHDLGLQRYGHIRSLVLSDAAKAFEATKKDDAPFGLEMLSKLRTLLKKRRIEGTQLYECIDEHLEGFAYSLTSQCKIYWSHDRPWETD